MTHAAVGQSTDRQRLREESRHGRRAATRSTGRAKRRRRRTPPTITDTQNTQDAALTSQSKPVHQLPVPEPSTGEPDGTAFGSALRQLSLGRAGKRDGRPGPRMAASVHRRLRVPAGHRQQSGWRAELSAVAGRRFQPRLSQPRSAVVSQRPDASSDRRQPGVRLHGYDPTPTAAAAQASGNRLAPFPNLYRFFEMVETHSRVNGAGGWASLAASSRRPTGATDLRESRVAGKINPNVIADEEIFKAWLDSEEAMPFWVVNDLSVKVGLGMAPAAALSAGDDRYRPINYPADISSSYFDPTTATTFAPGAVRALAWNGNRERTVAVARRRRHGQQQQLRQFVARRRAATSSSTSADLRTTLSPRSVPLAFYPRRRS